MKIPVSKFDIINEMDIVLAHKRASQLGQLTGMSFYGKTCFITAISEIGRNAIEHVGSGTIVFNVKSDGSMIEAVISDKGNGIENLEFILNRSSNPDEKGTGLKNAKKLVDIFTIQTSERGTTVTLGMKVNSKTLPVTRPIIEEWAEFFKAEKPTSPYEEIKRQNDQLLEITDQLRIKNIEIAEQLYQIKKLNIQLNKANQELEDFASTLSHDLRSPISNLKMILSIMNNSKTANKYDLIDRLKNQVYRLDDMILGLAEIIDLKNTQNVIVNRVYFHDILNVVKEELMKEIVATDCVVLEDFDKQPYINYYEVYLHSIMLNLVSNAIKYRKENVPPEIKITSGREGQQIFLHVEDNGEGMDLEKIGEDLFKPFRRFDQTKEGKGIGLHLIKGMVEKNGGCIEVISEPGQGSSFKVKMEEF